MSLDVVVGGLPVGEFAREKLVQALPILFREPACDPPEHCVLGAGMDLLDDGVER